MQTLITGGTGFIGRSIAVRLLSDDEQVVVLTRRARRGAELEGLGATIIEGNIANAEDVRRALHRCDRLVHCAGVPGPARRNTFHQVHIDGTRIAFKEAAAAGVQVAVNISSQAAVFSGTDITTDDRPQPNGNFIDPYSETKAAAETIALHTGADTGMPTVNLRPGVVWGPGDSTVLPVIVRLARSPLGIPMIGRGDNLESTIYIDNLVDAVLAAMRPDSAGVGRSLFVTDKDDIAWREFYTGMLDAVGASVRFRRVPHRLAATGARVLDTTADLLRLPIPLAQFGVAMAATSRSYNADRAADALDWSPRIDRSTGLAALSRWAAALGGPAAVARFDGRELAVA